MGQKQTKNEKTEEATALCRRKKIADRKIESIDCPEIPDRARHQRVRPPFGPKERRRLKEDFESIRLNIAERTRRREIRPKKRD